MSTIQANPTTARSRARELITALPQDADAEGRIQAARTAVDRLESEFPGSPEAATLKMVKALVHETKRGVTQETLLNAGLELCQRGAVAGSSYLAGAALELARNGWDAQDKDRLVAAGYKHLRTEGVMPQPERVLKLAEKYGGLIHQTDLLEDAVAGAKDPQGLAATLVRHENDKWFDLASGLLEHLAQDGPQELRGAYALAGTMTGSWFKKLDGYAHTQIYRAFLADPIRTPGDGAARAGVAVASGAEGGYSGHYHLLKAGLRAMDALEPPASPADKATLGMTRRILAELDKSDSHSNRRQRVVGRGLRSLGSTDEVSGRFLARTARALLEAGGFSDHSDHVIGAACTFASESAGDGRWRAAFRDLGRLAPHMGDSYYSTAPLKAFERAMDELAKLPQGQDPVEAMVRGVSAISQSGDPAGVIGDFLGGKDTGALKNTPAIRELLAVLAEDGATPQMRATARFIHRAMENGELEQGIQSMKDAFEIQRMANAGNDNPNAVKLSDDQVQIGGVVIRRKTEAQ